MYGPPLSSGGTSTSTWGNHGRAFHGKTLTGSACSACSTRIYDEPGFYEQCVAAQEVLKNFGPKP